MTTFEAKVSLLERRLEVARRKARPSVAEIRFLEQEINLLKVRMA